MEKDDFETWLQNPVTVRLHGLLRKRAAEVRDDWRNGVNWTNEARVVVEAYEAIANLEYDEMMETNDE